MCHEGVFFSLFLEESAEGLRACVLVIPHQTVYARSSAADAIRLIYSTFMRHIFYSTLQGERLLKRTGQVVRNVI